MVRVWVLDYIWFGNIVETILRYVSAVQPTTTQKDVKLLKYTETIENYDFSWLKKDQRTRCHTTTHPRQIRNTYVFDSILRLPNRVDCRSSSKCVFIVGLWSEMIISVNVCHYYYCRCPCDAYSSNKHIGILVVPCKERPAYEKM